MSDMWTPSQARGWLARNGIKPIKPVHRKGNQLRYRIKDPSLYRGFVTKVVDGGIHLVIGIR